MNDAVHIDFETRSRVDIAKAGAERYARDASTSMLCLAWCFDGETEPSAIAYHEAPPARLIEHVRAGRPVWAHNAAFELAIWNEVLHARAPTIWPRLEASQVYDTMACALMMALPASLGELASVLRISDQKDDEGKRLMLRLAKPDKESGQFSDPDADLPRLIEYCKQDVRAEMGVMKHLVMLPPFERELWVLDHKINNRGIPLDIGTIKRLSSLAERERARVHDDVAVTTLGAAGSANEVKNLIEFLAGEGVATAKLRAGDVDALLAGNLSDAAREVLELRREASKVSAKKLDAMLARVCDDGRARGTVQFMGAGNTGRWAGRGIQVQNLKRTPKGYDVDDVIRWSLRDDGADVIRAWYGSAIDAVSLAVRGMIKAPDGYKLIANDYSNIEGRVLAWVANETWKLDAFKAYDTFKLDEHGRKIPDPKKKGEFLRMGYDLYLVAYGASFGKHPTDVTEDERQIGKVQELALGYQGGKGAFASMAINYGIRVVEDDDETRHEKNTLTVSQVEEIKKAWRAAHPNVVKFWHMLEEAAINAVRNRGAVYRVGPVAYRVSGNYLMCRLPSGRCLFYAGPSIIEVPGISTVKEVETLCEAVAAFIKQVNEETGAMLEPPKPIDISRDTFERALDRVADYLLALQDAGLKQFAERALEIYEAMPNDKRPALQTWGTDSKTKKWGRRRPYGGLLCVAGDAEVLTDSGWKRLDAVTSSDRIYDGVEFVRHDGLALQGYKNTISVDGVRMTPDHKVLTSAGWISADETPGKLRPNVREPQSRYVANACLSGVARDARQMRTAVSQIVETIRRAGCNGLPGMANVCGVLARHGFKLFNRADAGSHQPRWQLLPGKLSVGLAACSRPQQTRHVSPHGQRNDVGGFIGNDGHKQDDALFAHCPRRERFGFVKAGELCEPVYDLINCGPRRRFVVRGTNGPFIVHNCENLVQAIARDILAAALVRLEKASYRPVMHIHDEVVCEVLANFGSQAEMARIMTVLPDWAHGLPIAASGWEGKRYRK